MKRSKKSRNWTGYIDKDDVLIMIGDSVHQEGIRSGCYNNEDRVITVGQSCDGLYADGYYSDRNTVLFFR